MENSKSKLNDEQNEKTNTLKKQTLSPLSDQLITNPKRNIKLNKFIPGKFPNIGNFATVSIYGKRKTGKTVFIKWFMQAYKHLIPWGWVFTKTSFNSAYASWFPEKFIIPSFDPQVLTSIMDRQKAAIQYKEGEDPGFNAKIVIIWDDYNDYKDIRYNQVLHDYYFIGRHFWSLNVFSTQHIKVTPPAIRSNTDLVVLFNTDYKDSLECYWNDFAGKMDKYEFYEMFREATREKNTFLAIDNNPNTPWEEKFFQGKADLLPEKIEYIFGCREFWKDNQKQLEEIQQGDHIEKAKMIKDNAEWREPQGQDKQKSFESVRVTYPIKDPDDRKSNYNQQQN